MQCADTRALMHAHTHAFANLNWKKSERHTPQSVFQFANQTSFDHIFMIHIELYKTRLSFKKDLGCELPLFKQTQQAPNALISPSSLTHACSTSAESELHLFVSVAVGQVSSKRPRTTNTDTHSLGSLSCPPIKGVYRRLPHDVIPAPNAKLITTIEARNVHLCLCGCVCEGFHMSNWTVVPNESWVGMRDNKACSLCSKRSEP